MWQINRDHKKPIEKSLSNVFGSQMRRSDYRSKNDYAWMKTSWRMNVLVASLIVFLFILRVGVVAHMDTDEHKVLYEFLNVLTGLTASIIAAYIFRLVTVHWPEMRKQYHQQEKIESYVSSILLHYHDLYAEMLGPHERIKDERGGYFEEWNSMQPREIHKLMVARWQGKYSEVDPFGHHFYQERNSIRAAARKLQEHENDLGYDLWNLFGIAAMMFEDDPPILGKPKDDEFHRLYHLQRLGHAVRPFFNYAKYLVREQKHVSPYMEICIGGVSYQSVWDDTAMKQARYEHYQLFKDRRPDPQPAKETP